MDGKKDAGGSAEAPEKAKGGTLNVAPFTKAAAEDDQDDVWVVVKSKKANGEVVIEDEELCAEVRAARCSCVCALPADRAALVRRRTCTLRLASGTALGGRARRRRSSAPECSHASEAPTTRTTAAAC